jgi:hypothetical protein
MISVSKEWEIEVEASLQDLIKDGIVEVVPDENGEQVLRLTELGEASVKPLKHATPSTVSSIQRSARRHSGPQRPSFPARYTEAKRFPTLFAVGLRFGSLVPFTIVRKSCMPCSNTTQTAENPRRLIALV